MKTNRFAIIFLSTLSLGLIASCSNIGVQKGNGNVTSKTLQTKAYDTIELRGGMDVYLIDGSEGEIKVSADENLFDAMKIEVEGDRLIVGYKEHTNISTTKDIEVRVPVQELSGLYLKGSGDIKGSKVLRADNLEVDLLGSGNISLNVEASEIRAQLSGSGAMNLQGAAKELFVSLDGSGDFNGFEMKAQSTEVTLRGSGNAKVVAQEQIKASASGSGDVIYRGSPAAKEVSSTGSGMVRNEE